MRATPALPAPLAAACRAAARAGDAWLVGGAVRDLLLGRRVAEVDILVLGGVGERARAVTRALAKATGQKASLVVHARFRTATVVAGPWRADLTEARRERYPSPGRLPEVSFPATLEDDLGRRDFTVNALAVRLGAGGARGEPAGGLEDLWGPRGRPVWRVFHPLSFVDDPTRLFRLARYRRRFGGSLAPPTRKALCARGLEGAFGRVSPARWRAEVAAVVGWGRRRLLGGRAEEAVLRGLLGGGWVAGEPGSVAGLLASCRGPDAPAAWARLGATKRELAALAPLAVAGFPGLAPAASAAEADGALAGLAPLALTVARRGAAGPAVRRWLKAVRGLDMPGGRDLLGLGIAAGPEVAMHLAAARAAALKGEAAPTKEGMVAWIRGRIARP